MISWENGLAERCSDQVGNYWCKDVLELFNQQCWYWIEATLLGRWAHNKFIHLNYRACRMSVQRAVEWLVEERSHWRHKWRRRLSEQRIVVCGVCSSTWSVDDCSKPISGRQSIFWIDALIHRRSPVLRVGRLEQITLLDEQRSLFLKRGLSSSFAVSSLRFCSFSAFSGHIPNFLDNFRT